MLNLHCDAVLTCLEQVGDLLAHYGFSRALTGAEVAALDDKLDPMQLAAAIADRRVDRWAMLKGRG